MKKLIFIDDNPLDQFILKRILTRYQLSYEVKCTADGGEVLQFLKQYKGDWDNLPDLILLDIYMPQINGWAFLKKLRGLYPKLVKPVKIYILSSSINPNDMQQAKQYPFVKSFIFKPITREMLEKLVNEEISGMV